MSTYFIHEILREHIANLKADRLNYAGRYNREMAFLIADYADEHPGWRQISFEDLYVFDRRFGVEFSHEEVAYGGVLLGELLEELFDEFSLDFTDYAEHIIQRRHPNLSRCFVVYSGDSMIEVWA